MKNAFLLFISIVFAIVLGEILLQITTNLPISENSNKINDARLGYKLSPSLDDVDEMGFRNPDDKYGSHTVAAIGDSHTYGNNVRSEKSWPRQFEALTGNQTYNFGVGSYGIFNYHSIFMDNIKEGVNGIIIAIYPANDFKLSYKYCSENADLKYWSNEIEKLELSAPSDETSCRKYYRRKRRKIYDIFDYLKYNSATISAIDLLILENMDAFAASFGIGGSDEFQFPRQIGPIKKQRARKRANKTDLAHPNLQLMIKNFEKFARYWKMIAVQRNIHLGIMVLPSRERVIYELLERAHMLGDVDPEFVQLVAKQVELEKFLAGLIIDIGIPLRVAKDSVATAMNEALEDDVEFYPNRDDGHPFERGYRAYANVATDLWNEMRFR